MAYAKFPSLSLALCSISELSLYSTAGVKGCRAAAMGSGGMLCYYDYCEVRRLVMNPLRLARLI